MLSWVYSYSSISRTRHVASSAVIEYAHGVADEDSSKQIFFVRWKDKPFIAVYEGIDGSSVDAALAKIARGDSVGRTLLDLCKGFERNGDFAGLATFVPASVHDQRDTTFIATSPTATLVKHSCKSSAIRQIAWMDSGDQTTLYIEWKPGSDGARKVYEYAAVETHIARGLTMARSPGVAVSCFTRMQAESGNQGEQVDAKILENLPSFFDLVDPNVSIKPILEGLTFVNPLIGSIAF